MKFTIMSNDVNSNLPAPIPMQPVLTGLIQSQAGLTDAVNYLAQIQAAHMRATFMAMPLDQRDTYCQVLRDSRIFGTKDLQQVTGVSAPTMNRHLNGKNS